MTRWSLKLGSVTCMKVILLVALSWPGVQAKAATQVLREGEAARLMEEAVVFAYPLILMNLTKDVMTAVSTPDGQRAPINQFAHVRQFTDPSMTDVLSPNVDTLYSFAWLDLSHEPMILSVPDTHDRYYLMPVLDIWTNVIASLGKRTTGTKAGVYAIIGPAWAGQLPYGVIGVRAPTNLVWVVGRIQCDGVLDIPAVNSIQDDFRLMPLSAWGADYSPPSDEFVNSSLDLKMPPAEQVANMSALKFLQYFARAIRENPPAESDAGMVRKFEALGIEIGQDFDPTRLDAATWVEVERGLADGFAAIDRAAQVGNSLDANGWLVRYNLGSYGKRYLERAMTARIGLGTNLTADAFHPYTDVDAAGNKLTGERSYILHFPPSGTPPVQAFWSVTMYDTHHLFAGNPLNRFALGSRDHVRFNADGSLDILLSHESPGLLFEDNWLPAPKGPFNLIIRAYWPGPEVLSGRWLPQAVTRVD